MPDTALAGGLHVTTFPAPPAGFDFEKATEADRQKYGMPKFPTPELQQRFLTAIKGARIIEPQFKARDRRRAKLPPLTGNHGVETTNIWSGGVVYHPTGDKIWDVNGTWNIPTPSLPSGAQNGIWYTASSWVGIDGDGGSPDVLQAGCDADIMESAGKQQIEYNPWWEWWPAGSYWITNMPAKAGDQFFCWIQCLPMLASSAKPNSGLILLINNSQAYAMFFVATAPAGTALQGNCAEWILEALETGPGGAPELAKYSTVKFTNCAAVTVKDKVLYPDVGNTINMVNSSGSVISKGTFVGTREVDVSYV
jgi:hypothetical protein